jgi:hypothetical protein
MDVCERCLAPSDLLNDDLVCQDCIESEMDFAYELAKERWYEGSE